MRARERAEPVFDATYSTYSTRSIRSIHPIQTTYTYELINKPTDQRLTSATAAADDSTGRVARRRVVVVRQQLFSVPRLQSGLCLADPYWLPRAIHVLTTPPATTRQPVSDGTGEARGLADHWHGGTARRISISHQVG